MDIAYAPVDEFTGRKHMTSSLTAFPIQDSHATPSRPLLLRMALTSSADRSNIIGPAGS